MTRWSSFSSDDFNDEPWGRPEPCQTRGCAHICDVPSMSAFCYWCRMADLEQRATNERIVLAATEKMLRSA